MADKRNRTPFYGAVPTYSLQADHVFMADGTSVQDALSENFELVDTITLEEDVATIDITLNKKYKSLIIVCEMEASSAATNGRIYVNNSVLFYVYRLIYTSKYYTKIDIMKNHNTFYIDSMSSTNKDYGVLYSDAKYHVYTDIETLSINTYSTNMITGSIITIYGIPA